MCSVDNAIRASTYSAKYSDFETGNRPSRESPERSVRSATITESALKSSESRSRAFVLYHCGQTIKY